MRIWVYLLVLGLFFNCCRSRERMMYNRKGYVTTQPVQLTVQENVRDTIILEEEEKPVRQESVKLTQGKDLMRYCVIVGSFVYKQNAVDLRNKLMGYGFFGSSIMQNEEGMYRVSAVCDDTSADAWREVYRIRSQYPQFRDAWMLEVKD